MQRTGLSAGEVNAAIAADEFPAPRAVVQGEALYDETEIQSWIARKPEMSRDRQRGWKARG
jgi:predicted DNA-binding transcriptional regulator AlpA